MRREIENRLFCIKMLNCRRTFYEVDCIEELYKVVAFLQSKGYIVTSVTEILSNGSTPKIPVMSKKEYKDIYKRVLKGEQI